MLSYRWRVMATEWLFDWAGPWHIMGASVILPFAQKDFGVSTSAIVWFTVIYSISTATFILPAAYLGNIVGRRRMVILGAVLDASSQIGITLSPSLAWLIPLRSVGGMGNACLLSNLPALVVEAFPAEQRGRTLGIMGLGVGIGILFTAPLAGLLADTLGWRYLFVLTSSMYFALLLAAIFVVRESLSLSKEKVSVRRFDYPGMLLVGMFLTLLTLAMQRFSHSSTVPLAAGMASVAIFAAIAFVLLELRSPYPLIDPRLFKGRGLSLAVSRGTLVTVISSADQFLIPFYLITGLGWSGAFAGTVMMAQTLAQPIFSPIAGALVDRIGPNKPIVIAFVLMIVGGISLITLGSHPSVIRVAISLFVMGAGSGLFMTPNRHELFVAMPKDKLSLAQAVWGMSGHGFGSVGSAMGATLLGVFMAQGIPVAFQTTRIITLVILLSSIAALIVLFRTSKLRAAVKAEEATVPGRGG